MLLKVSILLILSLCSLSTSKLDFMKASSGSHYAVLVAGSNGFWNYRHQSDVFHAYHILIENGMPKENIIVFAFDDIANDPENPFPGQIFNRPDPSGQGKDVYSGLVIDYRGNDVTPQNFLNVLSSDAEKMKSIGSGRVLQSTANDNVFIFFSDHGAAGLIAFPNGELYANDLMTTLKGMHDNQKYNKLVFYLEACESGSMFDGVLPNDMRIYATTAANPNQSSWATYCSPDDKINGKSVGSCLGDEYSVNWMEDSDASKGLSESLEIQYENVKGKTQNSEVHQYGDLTYVSNKIGDYQGTEQETTLYEKVKRMFNDLVDKMKDLMGRKPKTDKKSEEYKKYLDEAKKSRVNSRDAKLRYLYERSERMNDLKSHEDYLIEVKHMKKADTIFSTFDKVFALDNSNVKEINFECLKPAVEAYKTTCMWGEYDLKFVRNIALACQRNSAEDIAQAFRNICKA